MNCHCFQIHSDTESEEHVAKPKQHYEIRWNFLIKYGCISDNLQYCTLPFLWLKNNNNLFSNSKISCYCAVSFHAKKHTIPALFTFQLGSPSKVDRLWNQATNRGHRRSARRTPYVYAVEWVSEWVHIAPVTQYESNGRLKLLRMVLFWTHQICLLGRAVIPWTFFSRITYQKGYCIIIYRFCENAYGTFFQTAQVKLLTVFTQLVRAVEKRLSLIDFKGSTIRKNTCSSGFVLMYLLMFLDLL